MGIHHKTVLLEYYNPKEVPSLSLWPFYAEELGLILLGSKFGAPNGPIATQPPLNRQLSKIKKKDLFPHLCIYQQV